MMISKKFMIWNSVERKEQYKMGILTGKNVERQKDVLELITEKQLGQNAQGWKTGKNM